MVKFLVDVQKGDITSRVEVHICEPLQSDIHAYRYRLTVHQAKELMTGLAYATALLDTVDIDTTGGQS